MLAAAAYKAALYGINADDEQYVIDGCSSPFTVSKFVVCENTSCISNINSCHLSAAL